MMDSYRMGPTVTHLEITDPAQIRAPNRHPELRYELERSREPGLSRWFYLQVGAEYNWTDRIPWPDERWAAWEDAVETWVATADGRRVGYFELWPRDGAVQLAFLGLLPGYLGRGIGGDLLVRALERGFELADRVWVHTSSDDSEHALANYQARGMRVFKREGGG
jgi:ribosomal protein S18 acetylase RimI-like enzyme